MKRLQMAVLCILLFQYYLDDITISDNPLDRRSVIRVYRLEDLQKGDYSHMAEIEGNPHYRLYW